MKKMNVFIAALTLAISSVTPIAASAAQTISNTSEKPFGKVNLFRNYPSHYTLTIPSGDIDLNELDNNGEIKKQEISLNAYLGYGEMLKVTVTSAEGWKLMDLNRNNDKPIKYKLKTDEKDLTDGDNVVIKFMDTDNGTGNGDGTDNKELSGTITKTLEFYDFGDAVYAGTYKDILTFTVEPDDVPAAELAARLTTTTTATTTTTTTPTTTNDPDTTTTPTNIEPDNPEP